MGKQYLQSLKNTPSGEDHGGAGDRENKEEIWFIKVYFSLPLFGILQCVGLFFFWLKISQERKSALQYDVPKLL